MERKYSGKRLWEELFSRGLGDIGFGSNFVSFSANLVFFCYVILFSTGNNFFIAREPRAESQLHSVGARYFDL
jgi:hypothetical protein